MKHKVGDRVRIKPLSYYNKLPKDAFGDASMFTAAMSYYCRRRAVITSLSDGFYRLDIDNGYWKWSDGMLSKIF